MSDVTTTNSDTTTTDASNVTVESTETKPVETKPADETKTVEIKPVEVDDPTELKSQVEHWKKFSRQHEDTAKQLTAEKEAWVKAREDYEAKLSKTSTALEEKVAELTRITTESLKAKAAAEYKLPETALSFITASDEAGIKEQAEALSGLAGFAKPKPLQLKTQGQAGNNAIIGDPVEALKQWQAKNLKK